MDGGSWRNSGYTQSGLSVGSHTVEFRDVSGWTKPGNVTVTIIANQTTTISQAYQITNPVPPEIFTISYQTAGTSDTCIDSSGETFTGTLINVTFNYEDPNGDGHKNDGAKVWAFGNFDATNFSTFNGDGFAGSITSHLCYRFGESTSVNIQMQLEDGADNLSNSLTINVPKPPGGA